jgi:hypothetical protein
LPGNKITLGVTFRDRQPAKKFSASSRNSFEALTGSRLHPDGDSSQREMPRPTLKGHRATLTAASHNPVAALTLDFHQVVRYFLGEPDSYRTMRDLWGDSKLPCCWISQRGIGPKIKKTTQKTSSEICSVAEREYSDGVEIQAASRGGGCRLNVGRTYLMSSEHQG